MNSDDRDDQYWQKVEKADEIEQTAAGIRARRESQERRTRTVNDLMANAKAEAEKVRSVRFIIRDPQTARLLRFVLAAMQARI
jgi:hypothetical protein